MNRSTYYHKEKRKEKDLKYREHKENIFRRIDVYFFCNSNA